MDDLDQAKVQAKEKMLDTLLEYVGAHHAEVAAQILDKAEEKTEWDIPRRLDSRMARLFAAYRHKESFNTIGKKTGKVLGKAAVGFLVLSGSLVLLTSVSQAAKVKVFNFILDIQDKFTAIHAEELNPTEVEKRLKGWHDAYLPAYVPAGFQVVRADALNSTKLVTYANKEGENIAFSQRPVSNHGLKVDTENAQVASIEINGFEGLQIEKNGYVTLVWHNNDKLFVLNAKMDKDVLFKMAESLERKK